MAWVETWEDNLEATLALLSNLPANVLMEEVEEEEVVEDQVHHQHPLLHQHQVVVAARANGVYCTLDLTAEVHAGR